MTSSAAILAHIIKRYRSAYFQKFEKKPSLREISSLLDLDPSSLSKWTGIDTPDNRKVPIHQIPILAVALMMSENEVNTLMVARIEEQIETEPTIRVACEWITAFMQKIYQLDQDEQVVLNAYRELREYYPRGFYLDTEESELIRDAMSAVLKRADLLMSEEDNVGVNPEITQRIEVFKLKTKNKTKQNSPKVSAFKRAIRSAKLLKLLKP